MHIGCFQICYCTKLMYQNYLKMIAAQITIKNKIKKSTKKLRERERDNMLLVRKNYANNRRENNKFIVK